MVFVGGITNASLVKALVVESTTQLGPVHKQVLLFQLTIVLVQFFKNVNHLPCASAGIA